MVSFIKQKMTDRVKLKEYIEKVLEGTRYFLVDLNVSSDNDISVEIDSEDPVSIEECESLTRAIESEFDRDEEDYTLEVGSAGLTSPFKVKRQYRKYLGKEVEVVQSDGKKLSGILSDAGEYTFTVIVKEKIKKPDQKRPVTEDVPHTFGYDEIKQTKYLLKF